MVSPGKDHTGGAWLTKSTIYEFKANYNKDTFDGFPWLDHIGEFHGAGA